jgi:methylated-DNA-protein-cysteine methyltransferase related protein
LAKEFLDRIHKINQIMSLLKFRGLIYFILPILSRSALPPIMTKHIIDNAVKGRPQDDPSYRERAYELVLRIPAGRLMTYGLVAKVLGIGYDARAIGNIMYATPDDDRSIPWHRVLNAQGGCSTAGLTSPPDLQQRLLEGEGIVFNDKGKCAIEKYLWTPPEYDAAATDGKQGNLFA